MLYHPLAQRWFSKPPDYRGMDRVRRSSSCLGFLRKTQQLFFYSYFVESDTAMIRYLLIVLLTLFAMLPAKASDPAFAPSKDTLVQWVQDNAQGVLSHTKAIYIVKHTYLYAFKNEIDPLLLLSLLKVESGYRDRAVSPYNARGISQVVPRWHKDKIKGRNLTNTAVAIEVGAQILKDCADKYHGNVRKALGCYSGGGGAKYYNNVMKYRGAMNVALYHTANPKPRGTLVAAYYPS